MDTDAIIELGRQAILETLLISAPVLAVGMLVGLIIGLLQAVTQVQDQTVSFVPKLIAMLLTFSLVLPWLIARMVYYTSELFTGSGRF